MSEQGRYCQWVLGVFCLLLLGSLFGCGSDREVAEGEKIEVFFPSSSLAVDPLLEGVAVFLPRAEENSVWPLNKGNLKVVSWDGDISPTWKVKLGAPQGVAHFTVPPLISEGKVYVLDGQWVLHVLDLKTGKRLWKKSLLTRKEDESLVFSGGISKEEDILYVSTGLGDLFALTEEGETIWVYKDTTPVRSAPVIGETMVVIALISGKTLALDKKTGEKQWTNLAPVKPLMFYPQKFPVFAEGVFLVPASSSHLLALEEKTGNLLWSTPVAGERSLKTELEQIANVVGMPVVERDKVFVLGNRHVVMALDILSGIPRWSLDIGSYYGPWYAGNTLFFVTEENQLVALSSEGKVRWVSQIPLQEGKTRLIWMGPVLVDSKLFLLSHMGSLLVVDGQNGKILQEHELTSSVYLAPMFAEGKMLVINNRGYVLCW